MLVLHVPCRSEFGVRQRWLLDPQMMSYNRGWPVTHPGYDAATGCIDWPERDWAAFEERLARPASEQGYFYVRDDASGAFIGHVHYQVDPSGEAGIGLNVVPGRRGEGLGSPFLELLLERIWRDTDAGVVANTFEDTRIAAVRLHQRHGFVPDPDVDTAAGRPTRCWRRKRREAESGFRRQGV